VAVAVAAVTPGAAAVVAMPLGQVRLS